MKFIATVLKGFFVFIFVISVTRACIEDGPTLLEIKKQIELENRIN